MADDQPESRPDTANKQPDRVISPFKDMRIENGFDQRYMQHVNLNCGIKPIPPVGCTVAQCSCDQYGRNCKWNFICS